MQKTCKQCATHFEITDEDLSFYKKFDVPEPKNCPKCRLIRRLLERNTRKLYKRKCDFSGEEIISMYNETVAFPVYKTEIWWSDVWDGLDYGIDFDPTKSFFQQFKILANKVPRAASFIIGGTLTNSDFTNCTGYLKNCYLIFEADYNEDCYYSNRLMHCKNIVDCTQVYKCELCYECSDCHECYNLEFSRDCTTCSDSHFLFDCKSCSNCIGCINLRHKNFHIFNKPYSKEEYEKMKTEYHLDTPEGINKLEQLSEEFFKNFPHRNLQQEHNENCLGDHLYHSRDSHYCFEAEDLEDCRYCARTTEKIKSCMDYNSWGMGAELIYQSTSCGDNIYNLKFCMTCTSNLSDCEYCSNLSGCSNCFGCIGLKRKSYCILNKQYSKEEYEILRHKIIAHMKETKEYGEFFPLDISPFAYNESLVMDFYPLTKEEALNQGYSWFDKDTKEPSKDLPTCQNCSKNYIVIPQELKFYKQTTLPSPTLCPDCRHLKRQSKRNPKVFWDSTCANCTKQIQTTYDPKRDYVIYCEDCYKKTIT